MLKICLNNEYVDFEEQLKLFNETFNADFTKEKWQTKHFENPYTKFSENVCLYKDDELIGFNVFMPQRYIVEGKEMLFLQSCESAVAQRERGHGYLQKILSEAEQILKGKYGVIYGIPNNNSKPSFDKLGYKEKLFLDSMIQLGSIKSIISDIFHLDKIKTIEYRSDNSRVFFSEDIINDIGNIQNLENQTHIKKDTLLYDWKVNKNIGRTFQFIYALDELKNISAYCLVSFNTSGRIKRAEIVDFYKKEGCEKALKVIIRELKKKVSLITVISADGSLEQKVLQNVGFKIRQKKFAALVYKVISGDDHLEDIIERESWSFSKLEMDTILN